MRLPNGRGATILLALTAAAITLTAATALGYVSAADDNIPGVILPPSPVTGSLLDTQAVGPGDVPLWDHDDVFAVPLKRNERIEATLTPPAYADFDLYLLSYLAKSINHAFSTPSLIRAFSENGPGAVDKISFVSDRSTVETYYIDIAAMYDDDGDYELTWSKTQLPTPSLEVTAPALSGGYGTAATVSGTATVEVKGVERPMSGFTVYVMAMPAGSTTWTKVATTKTTTDGAFAATVKPTVATKYYAKTTWAYSKEDSSPIGYGASTAVTVLPKAYLAFSTTPRGAYAGKSFSVTGVIKPSHGSTSRHVKLWVYRHNGTRYVAYRYYWMRGSGTTWSGKLSLPKGRYRFSLVTPADSLHASTYGTAFRYMTVK